ncbi:YwdI family protein [Heyndrickxia sp. NPDC080065]|uniref:YwdI family protein n=1 Tax=Heyndrickxia sp. NPDC080065 TaxID=3390568 RepID=UPI003D074DCE
MSISLNSLLNKIEQEMKYAKQTKDESMAKKHIYSIKTLCEVILEEEKSGEILQTGLNNLQTNLPVTQSISTVGKAEPLKTDDGSNGESIFDF